MIDQRRRERLGALFREEIAWVIEHRVRDPRVGFVSVTGVNVSADLSVATVFVSVFGEEETARRVVGVLSHAAPFIRSEVAKRVRLRQIPAFRFVEDDSIRHGATVDRLLKEWHEEASGPES